VNKKQAKRTLSRSSLTGRATYLCTSDACNQLLGELVTGRLAIGGLVLFILTHCSKSGGACIPEKVTAFATRLTYLTTDGEPI